jgi:hypothetical protein
MKDIIQLGLITILLSLWAISPAAKTTVVMPGAWCKRTTKHALSASQQDILQTKLRRITGWTQLAFTENGKLEIGDFMAIDGGSGSARKVLLQALRCGKQFVIEDHSSSATVNFGQLDEGTNYADDRSGMALEIYRVRLDFSDFSKMHAAPAVMESFDEGFTLFHELLHGLGLKDTHVINEIGECETVVNRMRAELGLPLRDQYLAESLRMTNIAKIIRLRFKQQILDRQGIARWKTHHLFFTPDFASPPESLVPSPGTTTTTACLSLY